MLKRILTAILLIPVFVILLLKLSAMAFCIFTAVMVVWCAYEWSFFIGVNKFPLTFIYPVIVASALALALLLPIQPVLYIAGAWWLIAAMLVIRYPRGSLIWGKGLLLRAVMGLLVLVPCWLAINYIRMTTHGTYILLFLFILIWGADSGAYFVGKKWGKNKLLPLVSPGKTWQGLFGALITTVIFVFFTLIVFKTPYADWLYAFTLSIITVLFSVLGDLFESMLKRNVNLKDSGVLLPGHGGIMDRIDSLTAAAPIFVLCAMWAAK